MAKDKERGWIKMIGIFGSFVTDSIPVGTDLVDLIYEQEKLRYPNYTILNDREKFSLVNFNLTAPAGTSLLLNGSEYCRVVINETRQLIIPNDYFKVTSCVFESDVAGINCRYLY